MFSSQTQNKIYAIVSISLIVSVIASFAATVNFLVGINNLVFSIDDRIVKEKTIVLDKDGFDKLKDKLVAPEAVFLPPNQPSPVSPSSAPALEPALSPAPTPSVTSAVQTPF